MNSFQETQRQIRIALIAMGIIVPVGIFGFMLLEHVSFLDAVWITVTTLTTIGYGDKVAVTQEGRIFTLVLIVVGLGAVAFAIQATATFLVSPVIREMSQRRRIQTQIDRLESHYIVCGVGEMVDKTIGYIVQRAADRQAIQRELLTKRVDRFLDRIFGSGPGGSLRAFLRRLLMWIVQRRRHSTSLLDVIVVITTDVEYAEHLRGTGLLVVEGQPADDAVLKRAGVDRAEAMMVMLDNDTEALFTVLTARSHNANLFITVATLEEELAEKMTRVGANSVIAPFDVAGTFLNNTTLRPAVADFFRTMLFDQSIAHQTIQLYLADDSPWIGQHLGGLQLRERFNAGVIGIREAAGSYLYAPGFDYILKPNEVVLTVVPTAHIRVIQNECHPEMATRLRALDLERLMMPPTPPQTSTHTYSLEQAEHAVESMSEHFVICGTGRVARNAINKLAPERPFVIVSDNEGYTEELLARGFRVIHGSPTHEKVLQKAGVDRALATMVAIEDKADAVLTVLTCRAMSKRLLITATADSDDMVPKLRRTGADRVVSPFQIAAQFVLLATTSPATSDFFQYVLFNYSVGLETTELYMEEESPWIGQTIEALRLDRLFRAGVIGVRLANGNFVYAPPDTHVIGEKEVLIVTTPMVHSDELRVTAHGSATKRPRTLRRDEKSGVYSRSAVEKLSKKP